MANIDLSEVTVAFPGPKRGAAEVTALHRLDLSVADEEFVCLLGPSGCGKSTALNVIAGFQAPSSGRCVVDGEPVTAPGVDRGVVFQDANIFPWLTVRQNVAFGPSLRAGRKHPRRRAAVDGIIDRVALTGFADNLPLELSGGMRQRVGLARVLVNDPPVLLMDEPFGALDAQTRIIMQELLLELWETQRKTVLFVTHDIDEALLLGDRVVVMTARPGRVKEQLQVPLPRPRSYEMTRAPEFLELKARLFDTLHSEAVRADQLEARR
ncbi:ABC transporter ATP-binding protein [Actinomadura madurae]|uniref:ABC transporter ATP-binding protein n=1 Tax=Actinomadura madurae TaxID=1993 RepID=UPI000D8BABB9|nr:ABC transporter ATP-binding protein [Actinomadura madurae]SPT50339.1 Aliphatic sulfonates import ATP-binding protein SsuB [Actinomadura madurae]